MYHAPLAVNVDAVIGDVPSRGNLAVALGEQGGGLQTQRRESRGAHLHVVLPGDFGIGDRRGVLRVIFLRAVESVLERDQ